MFGFMVLRFASFGHVLKALGFFGVLGLWADCGLEGLIRSVGVQVFSSGA